MARLTAGRLWVLGVSVILALGGCSFGPKVLERTHGRYNESIRHVEEEELLRNIVLLRYAEPTSRLNIQSIAAQYELSGHAEARPFFNTPNPAFSSSYFVFKMFPMILPDFLLTGANRPTISLTPGDTSETVRHFLTPINLDSLAFLARTRWPTSVTLRLWVGQLNGVPNASADNVLYGTAQDCGRFHRITELLEDAERQELVVVHAEEREVEVGGPFLAAAVTGTAGVEAARSGMRDRPQQDGTYVLVRQEQRLVLVVSPGAEANPVVAELISLLNLVPGQQRYDITLASGRMPDPARVPTPPSTAIRVLPRSTSLVWLYLANGVEVPQEHLACGLVQTTTGPDGVVRDDREFTRGLFEVRVCRGWKPPPNAHVAVQYRDYWYYIDDRDLTSKATFLLVLKMSRIDFSQRPTGPSGPVLTLPVGR